MKIKGVEEILAAKEAEIEYHLKMNEWTNYGVEFGKSEPSPPKHTVLEMEKKYPKAAKYIKKNNK